MKKLPKLLWIAPAILALGVTAILLFNQVKEKTQSTLTLASDKDRFKFDFQIEKSDESQAKEFLALLNLPSHILQGVNFSLDATSSATLAFKSPIVTKLDIENKSINFKGELASPLTNFQTDQVHSYKIPSSSYLAVFGENLTDIVVKKISPNNEFTSWLTQNKKSKNGDYFLLFEKGDFALIFENENVLDFSKLEQSLKQEDVDGIKVQIVKVTDDKTIAIFQIGNLSFITTSIDSAKELLKTQKGESPSVNFPPNPQKDSVSAIVFLRSDQNDIDLSYFVENQSKLNTYLENIKELYVEASGKNFSGHLEVK